MPRVLVCAVLLRNWIVMPRWSQRITFHLVLDAFGPTSKPRACPQLSTCSRQYMRHIRYLVL